MIDYDAIEREVKSSRPPPIDYDAIEQEVKGGGKPVTNPPEEPRSLAGFGKNILSSGANLVSDVYNAVSSPLQTAKAIGSVATGAIAGMSPMAPEAKAGFAPNIEMANQVGEHFKNRYGGVDKALNTLYNDPVGFAADLSTVFSGAGGLIKGAGNISKVAELQKAGQIVSDVGKAADPVRLMKMAAKVPIKAVSESGLPEKMYQSALKPSTTLTEVEKGRVVGTGLKEGIKLTRGAVENVQDKIDGINSEIQAGVSSRAAQGLSVNTSEVVKKLDDVRAFFRETAAPQTALDQIDALQKEFQSFHGQQIPLDKAQRIKQNTYKVLRDAYGELKTAQVEGQKAIARGLKDEIAKQFQEVSGLNMRESDLLLLEKSVQRFVNRTGNKDLFSLGNMVKIAALGPKGLLLAVAEDPAVKSTLAIALKRAGKLQGTSRSALTPLSIVGKIPMSVNALSGE